MSLTLLLVTHQLVQIGDTDFLSRPHVRANGPVLTIRPVTMDDRGVYMCAAQGETAAASAILEVERRERPKLELYPEPLQRVAVSFWHIVSIRYVEIFVLFVLSVWRPRRPIGPWAFPASSLFPSLLQAVLCIVLYVTATHFPSIAVFDIDSIYHTAFNVCEW